MLAGRDLAALTIVRIGGQGLPVPERADDEGVNFVQLTWEEATGGDFGSTRLITFDGGSISPVFASKDHNLTPGIRDNGGSIRSSTATGHLLNEEQLDNLFDGDRETVYFGLTGMGDDAAPGDGLPTPCTIPAATAGSTTSSWSSIWVLPTTLVAFTFTRVPTARSIASYRR